MIVLLPLHLPIMDLFLSLLLLFSLWTILSLTQPMGTVLVFHRFQKSFRSIKRLRFYGSLPNPNSRWLALAVSQSLWFLKLMIGGLASIAIPLRDALQPSLPLPPHPRSQTIIDKEEG
ncbi:uncharacterized protein LOC130788980 isoform X2 [Actinidia eriantha]|uniref:uncharacterized protein LOC130788980 isoform X2 n=1 Tax=Actinidia eriantha TaxID=165200 RepID=UPI00258E3CDB|nr:uncharacterized protein LOC130788980 isoform X2 [Actinidia eriantha]